MTTKISAYAKVNPFFSLQGRRADGYHLIDGLCLDIELADEITITKRQDKKVMVDTSVGFIENNIATKLAEFMVAKFDLSGFDIFIKKNIPFSLGVGGSSADGAGVYKGILSFYPEISLTDRELSRFGADVPVMVKGGGRVKGIGEIIESVKEPPKYDMVIVYGDKTLSTKEVYDNSDRFTYTPHDLDEAINRFMRGEEGDYLFNDLERGAEGLQIQQIKSLLHDCGFSLVGMTGSGRGVVGYTLDDIQGKVAKLQQKQGKFNFLTTKLRG